MMPEKRSFYSLVPIDEPGSVPDLISIKEFMSIAHTI